MPILITPMTVEEIREVIDQVQCPPYRFRIHVKENGDEPIILLQAQFYRADTNTKEIHWGSGGKYYLSPYMTTGEIVKKCFVAARDYAEHEVREAFTWKGRRILGPHIDINSLFEVAEHTESRKENKS